MIKLIDFGTSFKLSGDEDMLEIYCTGTLTFMAPEIK